MRDEPGWTTAGKTPFRRRIQESNTPLHASAQDQGRDDRMGSGEWLEREYFSGDTDRARPLLCSELVYRLRPKNPIDDSLEGIFQQIGLLNVIAYGKE